MVDVALTHPRVGRVDKYLPNIPLHENACTVCVSAQLERFLMLAVADEPSSFI